jgi:hypothetical protein
MKASEQHRRPMSDKHHFVVDRCLVDLSLGHTNDKLKFVGQGARYEC